MENEKCYRCYVGNGVQRKVHEVWAMEYPTRMEILKETEHEMDPSPTDVLAITVMTYAEWRRFHSMPEVTDDD